MINSGYHTQSVKDAIKLINRNSTTHNNKEAEWRSIQALFEEGFSVYDPTGTKKITSKLLLQAIWKMVNKMKPLDFQIHGSGRPEINERIVTDGVATVMEEGGYANCFRDKNGAAYKMLLFGDAFMQIGTNEQSSYPIQFRVGSLSDIYFDNYCVDIRDATGGLSATEGLVVYRYSMRQFDMLYPEMKGKVVKGDIPRSYRYRKQLEKSWLQTFYDDEDEIEVAHYYRLGTKPTYTVFAGSACVIVSELTGKEYPFYMDKENLDKPEAYIPIIHYKCFPSSEGFYNYGIGHALYDLAIVMRRMDNMAFNHAEDNIYPINMVNMPRGEASTFFAKYIAAQEQRRAGGKGFIPMEYGPDGKQGVTLEPFQSLPITQEWERAFTRLERQITRLGIQLDAVDRGENYTATQILAEEENADQVIKQIMEFNASESKFAVEVTMDFIRKFISSKDKTPLNLLTEVTIEGEKLNAAGVTMGMVASELKKNKYFCRINTRSGSIPSNTMTLAQISRVMQVVNPQSPAFVKLTKKMADLNGQDVSMEELTPTPMAQVDPSGQPIPTETEDVNPAAPNVKNIVTALE